MSRSSEEEDRLKDKEKDSLNDSDSFIANYFDELLSAPMRDKSDSVTPNSDQKRQVTSQKKHTKLTESSQVGRPQISALDRQDSSQKSLNASPVEKKLINNLLTNKEKDAKDLSLNGKGTSVERAYPQTHSQKNHYAESLLTTYADSEKNKLQLQALLDRGLKIEAKTETYVIPEVLAAKQEVESVSPQAIKKMDTQEDWFDNGRPSWGQEKFDVLLFDVSGLTLAVPLTSLGQIQTIDNNLTPIFGQSDWFLGIITTPHGKVKTVNTALFVMPEKYKESSKENFKYVITINGLPWGLAVDRVDQPVALSPEDVKWRSTRTSRPWLAGTVKSSMCALLDIPTMGVILENDDKSAKVR